MPFDRLLEPTRPINSNLVRDPATYGDSLRVAYRKINTMFSELYAVTGSIGQPNSFASLDGSGRLEPVQRPVYSWLDALITNKPSAIALTGDASGVVNLAAAGSLSLPVTLANSGVAAGTYNTVAVDAKGRVIGGANVTSTFTNQTITLSGDVTGSGATTINASLIRVIPSTIIADAINGRATFVQVAVDAQGRVRSGLAFGAAGTVPSLQQVTDTGATSNRAITLTNLTDTTSTNTGALVVAGGVGISGNLNVGRALNVINNTGDAIASVQGPSGSFRLFRFTTRNGANSTVRWDLGVGNVAETGSDAGSDFYIRRFSDNGATLLPDPFRITRSSGDAAFSYDVATMGSLSVGFSGPNGPGYVVDARGTSAEQTLIRAYNLSTDTTAAAGMDAATGVPNAFGIFRVSNGGSINDPSLIIGTGQGINQTFYDAASHQFRSRNNGTLDPPVLLSAITMGTGQSGVLSVAGGSVEGGQVILGRRNIKPVGETNGVWNIGSNADDDLGIYGVNNAGATIHAMEIGASDGVVTIGQNGFGTLVAGDIIAGRVMRIERPLGSGTTAWAELDFYSGAAVNQRAWNIANNAATTDLQFRYFDDNRGNPVTVLNLDRSASGTHTLTGNLTVTGTIFGNMTTVYADLAERYETSEPVEPGDLVEIGGEAEVRKTSEYLSFEVFGVISTEPAIKMNSAAGNDVTHPYVALVGRVPCKVIGRVRKGQRLVASDIPGVATAAPSGASWQSVFGRALSDHHEDGQGIVEVIVGTR